MDLRKLKTLIDLVSDSNVSELEITEAEGKVRIVKSGPSQAMHVAQPSQILVLGGSGFVGHHLCQALSQRGVWLAMKGKHPQAELAELSPEISVFHVEPLTVPGLDAQRCLVWMRKSSPSGSVAVPGSGLGGSQSV